MVQRRRLEALQRFRCQAVSVLVCTDVASRGLDIPHVGLVVNYDVPRAPADYVHRAGRTARAGKAGRVVTLVTQYDVALVHAVEATTGTKLALLPGVAEDDVLVLLNKVTTARRVATMRLVDEGFEERLARDKQRGKRQRRRRRRLEKQQRQEAGGGGGGPG